MKIVHLTFLFVLTANILFGQNQNCNCIDDINSTSHLIKNAKSYTIQVKKAGREADFENWKEQIKQEIKIDTLSDFFCAAYLQKYISFINDKHNQIYKIPENISENVPNYHGKIDTTQNPTDEISGVYHAGAEKISLQPQNDSIWYGILLESNAKEWPKGKIRLRLKKTPNGKFELFEYYANGALFYQRDITVANGRIHSTFWNKENKYYFNVNQKENFSYKSISPTFDYIGIKTVNRTNTLITEANLFYEKTLPHLHSENLIIDLRNNGGGAIKQAQPLLKHLKANKEIKRIIVVMNFMTASSAESIALELKKDKRTILVGENSKGMMEYGYGNRAFRAQTDCSGYKVVLSTTHDKSNLDKYESIGLLPDFKFDNKSDWIDQVMEL